MAYDHASNVCDIFAPAKVMTPVEGLQRQRFQFQLHSLPQTPNKKRNKKETKNPDVTARFPAFHRTHSVPQKQLALHEPPAADVEETTETLPAAGGVEDIPASDAAAERRVGQGHNKPPSHPPSAFSVDNQPAMVRGAVFYFRGGYTRMRPSPQK